MPENTVQRQRQTHDAEKNTDISAAALRLNKVLALAGLASRRAADAMIAQGRVAVDGVIVRELGVKVIPGRHAVTVDGNSLAFPMPEHVSERHLYLMLHKPVQVLCTAKDPQGRETVLDLLPREYARERIYPVGRLDFFSEGLLLLTNDGELTLRLTHPRYHLPRVYQVRLRETPTPEQMEDIRAGMRLAEGERLAPIQAALLPGRQPVIEMTLHQGINRQIRRMCRDLSLTILALRRVQLGPLLLGELPRGAVRPLTADEEVRVKKAVGML